MASLPKYDLGPAGNAMREEVSGWLREHWYKERKAAHEALPLEMQGYDDLLASLLAEKGWIGISWPKKYSGRQRSPLEQLAFIEEMDGAEAPLATLGAGPQIIAPALFMFGTEEQKQKYIPAIARNDIQFCLGYSEPDAGSDLASLRTRAVQDRSDWVINGQKIWVTGAERYSHIWLAVRTDPQAKKPQAGISIFIVPLGAPGVSVVPSMAMYGHTFCNIFFDDVRVSDRDIVGGVNGGWNVIMAALAAERVLMGGHVARSLRLFDDLTEYVKSAEVNGKPLRLNPVVRERIGALAAELEVARQFVMRSIHMLEKREIPLFEAGMAKTFASELQERLTETALDILGTGAGLSSGSAGVPLEGKIEQKLRQSIMMVVGGGTNEIQRNVIARLALKLPRG